MEGGERCTFCSWKYSHYFELLQKNTHTHKCLIKGWQDIDGKYWRNPAHGPVQVGLGQRI